MNIDDVLRWLPTDTEEQWQAKLEARKQLAEWRMAQHDAALSAARGETVR